MKAWRENSQPLFLCQHFLRHMVGSEGTRGTGSSDPRAGGHGILGPFFRAERRYPRRESSYARLTTSTEAALAGPGSRETRASSITGNLSAGHTSVRRGLGKEGGVPWTLAQDAILLPLW